MLNGDMRVMYATMMETRTTIINASFLPLILCLSVAIRYSVVRRQFKNSSKSKEEVKLLDYQTQQMKLFPYLARALAQKFGADFLNSQYREMISQIDKGNFKLLDLVHHYSCGMKSLYTQTSFDGLLTIRQSIGGAGFSAWSTIPRVIDDYSPNPTFEGDNTVMF